MAKTRKTDNGVVINFTVLRLLTEKARRWWYHQKLREKGEIAEARKRERASVRSNVAHFKAARVIYIGPGGWTLYHREGSRRLKGHTRTIEHPFMQAAITAGITIIDATTAPEKNRWALVRKTPPYEDHITCAQEAAELGATLYNFDFQEEA